MNNSPATAKAGTLLSYETGTYSSHVVVGFFVVLRDFEPALELESYLNENPDQKPNSLLFSSDKHLAFLIGKGLLLEIEYGRIWFEYDSDSETFSFTPHNEKAAD